MKEVKLLSNIKLSASPKTKTIFITLTNDKNNYAITFDVLKDLQAALNWCSEHNEIRSIIIQSAGIIFSQGICEVEWSHYKKEQIESYFLTLQRIIKSMFHLPQTIIFDLQEGAKNVALELSLGADIKIASRLGNFAFDHLKLGITPACGAISLLSSIIGSANAKNYTLSSKKLSSMDLLSLGFILKDYVTSDQEREIQSLIQVIFEQAPIQRVQAKQAFLMNILEHLDKYFKNDFQCAKAANLANDWKARTNHRDYANVLDMQKHLRDLSQKSH